jgi:hypothetical protein
MTPLRQGYRGQAPDCPQEQLVVNAVLAGSWPHRAGEALVDHAATCETCREIAAVSVLLRDDIEHARIEMHIPAAGQVWWRAAVRARLESTHAAARPITWMHSITAAIVLGMFLAGLTTTWPMIPGAIATIRSFSTDILPSAVVTSAIAGGLAQSVLIGLVAAGLLLLAPLAVYFVLSDD